MKLLSGGNIILVTCHQSAVLAGMCHNTMLALIFPHLLQILSWATPAASHRAVQLERQLLHFRDLNHLLSLVLTLLFELHEMEELNRWRGYQRRCEVACSLECYWDTMLMYHSVPNVCYKIFSHTSNFCQMKEK